MARVAKIAATLAVAATFIATAETRADMPMMPGNALFYATHGDWRDVYFGLGGQASHINGGTLNNHSPCGGAAFFDCPDPATGFAGSGTHSLFGGKWGGGFRAELGWRLRWLRLFTLFQANYWKNLSGPVMGGRPGDSGTITADHRAYTWTFGAGLDSATVWPELLPPGWNFGIQGSMGPTWNTLGALHARGMQGGNQVAFDVGGGTHRTLAYEVGAFIQYAFNSQAAIQIGYASKWLGPFRGHGGVETKTINGAPAPSEIVGGVTTNRRRVDEIFILLTFRSG